MKKTISHKITVVFLALVMLLALLPAAVFAAETETLTFVHTNDVHGHFEVEPYVKSTADYYKQLNGSEKNVITASAGDVYSGGRSIASLSGGYSVTDVMNAAGYDVMAIGNNDFNESPGFGQVLNFNNGNALNSETGEYDCAANFTILGANVYTKGNDPTTTTKYSYGDQPLDAYTIFTTADGAKVGVFGIAACINGGDDTYCYITGTIAAAKESVAALQAENCDVIVCLAHTGWTGDFEDPASNASNDTNSYQIAKQVPGIDLIIDGHSHTIIGENGEGYLYQGTDGSGNAYDTLIVQTGCWGAAVGVVNLELNVDHEIIGKEAFQLSSTDYDTAAYGEPDQGVANVIDYWETWYQEKYETPLDGVVVKYFQNGERVSSAPDGVGIRLAEQNLGNLVTDAMKYGVSKMDGVEDVDVVFMTCTAIRASIEAGGVTYADILDVFANGGSFVVEEITGAELLEVLEECVDNVYKGIEHYHFKQVSGLSFTYDAATGKIISVTMSDGTALDENATYRVLGKLDDARTENITTVYDGQIELADMLIDYFRSDAYDAEYYAGTHGRIMPAGL